ncbi:MAG TPA: hypothetical protein PLL66_00940 [Bacteroidales bacterium]|nr:hypothetical protein [Bacteroidales bacterium]
MKKMNLLIAFIMIWSGIYCQNIVHREFNSNNYHNSILTNEFKVLDINFDKKLLAFKHIYQPRTTYDEVGEIYSKACNCNYTGMEDKPLSGIVMGVYDLSTQSYLKSFVIYNAAYSQEDCYTYELSIKMLDSAKQFFIEHDLDITKMPEPISLDVQGDEDKTFVFENTKFKYTNFREIEWENNIMNTISDLWLMSGEEKMIHQIVQDDNYYMVSGGRIDYVSAYKQGDEFVFLNLFYHTSSLAGFSDCEVYHFSPIFKLSDFK